MVGKVDLAEGALSDKAAESVVSDGLEVLVGELAVGSRLVLIVARRDAVAGLTRGAPGTSLRAVEAQRRVSRDANM